MLAKTSESQEQTLFLEDLSIGILVNIKMHRSKRYECLKFERIIEKHEFISIGEVSKYYGSFYELLKAKISRKDKLGLKTKEAEEELSKQYKRWQCLSVDRFIFRTTDGGYLIVPRTKETSSNYTITLFQIK